MAWNWERIEEELHGTRVALPRDQIVDGFNRVSRMIGEEWITSAVRSHGTLGALRVATVGTQLAALDGVPGADELLRRLRSDERSAFAELRGLWLLRSGAIPTSAELHAEVAVGSRQRRPDIRVRMGDDPWTYVEVSAPEASEAQRIATQLAEDLADVVEETDGAYGCEVFLRREPTASEAKDIRFTAASLCRQHPPGREDLPGLALLLLSDRPGTIAIADHPGEERRPGVAVVKFIMKRGIRRHVVVRVPFTDGRAAEVLAREARQLPTTSPGMLMLDVSGSAGVSDEWLERLAARLQPKLHTRVGAVCVFRSGSTSTAAGAAMVWEVGLIRNAHASHPMPRWIGEQLRGFPPIGSWRGVPGE